MLPSDPAATTDHREFPARFGWGMLASGCGVLATQVFVAGVVASGYLSLLRESRQWVAQGRPPLPDSLTWLFATIVLNLALAGLFAELLVLWAHEGVRAGVAVTAEAIEVSDWRGRRSTVPWADVQELWLIGYAGPRGVGKMRLKTPTGVVKIPNLVYEREPLMEEIVARAHLTEARGRWVRLVYRRGTDGVPPVKGSES